MEFRDSIEFLKVKDHMLVVQFSIATKKFDSFRMPFVTNKYLSLIQWEDIMGRLKRLLCKQLKLGEDDQMKTKGEFRIDESLLVTYRAKPKDECYIDFSKLSFSYDLSWMLVVEISRPERNPSNEPLTKSQKTHKRAKLSQHLSNETSASSVPSEQEYDPSPEMKQLMSRYTPGKSEGPNRKALGSPEYCPQSTEKYQSSSSTYTASRIDRKGVDFEQNISKSTIQKQLFGSSDEESSPIVLPSPCSVEKPVVRPKKRGLLETVAEEPVTRSRSHKKVTMDGWLTKELQFAAKSNPKNTSRNGRAKSNKDTEAGTSSKQTTRKENEDPVDLFDEENMEKMKDFMASSLIRQQQRKERKKELKNFEIKDCTDLSNHELKRTIRAFAPTILELFKSKSFRAKRFNPVLLTTGNILTESQVNFVLIEIEKQRPISEQGSKEDVLTEIVLPELIMHLFCQKFTFNIDEALDALNLQEEYTMLHLKDATL